MGKITLNGKPVSIAEQPPSLVELVAAVEREHIPRGMVVSQVKVGGERIDKFTLDDGSLIPCDPEQEVEISTLSTSELVAGSMKGFEDYLGRLVPGLKGIAKMLRGGDIESGMKLYRDVIDGLKVLSELLSAMRRSLEVDESALTACGKNLEELLGELQETLQELVEAQSQGDYERIADAVEFELGSRLKLWQEALPELRSRVESDDSAAV